MAHQNETEETPVWNLSAAQWDALVRRAASGPDSLEDGAYVRPEHSAGTDDLVFFATALNKPFGWGYPFLEAIPRAAALGASIGRAWHETQTGFVQFEVALLAAASELAADYESGASDLDFVTYEQAVGLAVRGTDADLAWLHREFARLARLSAGPESS